MGQTLIRDGLGGFKEETNSQSNPMFVCNPDGSSIGSGGGGGSASPASPFCAVSLDNTPQQVKASAGTFYGGSASNPSPERRWLKVFNKPSASVSMGTDSAVFSIELEPGTTTPIYLPAQGVALGGTGVAIAVTAGAAKNNNTAPLTADCIVNLAYA